MKYFTLILTISILGMLFSCKDKETTPTEQLKARVNIIPTYNGDTIDFNKTYTTQEGYTISYTKLNFIITKFKNNDKQLFESAIYRFDKNKRLLWEGVGDYSDFSSFSATIGVDSSQNHDDPSARNASDPLFILNSGDMHWGWNTGYIFIMLEGKADTTDTQTGNNIMSFSYHVGNDQLTRDFSFTNLQWTKVNNYLYETDIYLDLYKVFDGELNDIDIKSDRSSHSEPNQIPLSKKVIDNFIDALSNLE